jgi:hypothetical protein
MEQVIREPEKARVEKAAAALLIEKRVRQQRGGKLSGKRQI